MSARSSRYRNVTGTQIWLDKDDDEDSSLAYLARMTWRWLDGTLVLDAATLSDIKNVREDAGAFDVGWLVSCHPRLEEFLAAVDKASA